MKVCAGTGILAPGESTMYTVTLEGQRQYAVYVEPVIEGVDFDLTVLDENGNVVAQDVDETGDALCYVSPRWTGPFGLVVSSAKGISDYTIYLATENLV